MSSPKAIVLSDRHNIVRGDKVVPFSSAVGLKPTDVLKCEKRNFPSNCYTK